MSHYFSKDNEQLKSNEKRHIIKINGRELSFITDHGVFSKIGLDFGSRLLLESVLDDAVKSFLDLGCGYGPIGIVYKIFNPSTLVTMVDINDRAIKLTEKNSKLNKVTVYAFLSDGFSRVDGFFDLIVSNPPIRAGKEVIYRFFSDAKTHLTPEGRFVFVINRKHGAPSAIKKCETIFGSVEVVNKKSGYYVIKCRN